MRTRLGIAMTLALVLSMMSACAEREDLRARYELERMLWEAQLHQRRISLNFLRASQREIGQAIEAFHAVVAHDPLSRPGASTWDPGVVEEIRRIRVVSTVALANLYFLSEQYVRAGDFYVRTLGEDLALRPALEARLGVARSMFLTGEEDSVAAHCEEIFTAMRTSEDFWAGRESLPEVFINVPLLLVRLYREQEDRQRYDRATRVALDFYDRVAATWPDSSIAGMAAMGRVNVYLVREEWENALRAIDRVGEGGRGVSGDFVALLRGEILAHALERRDEGERALAEVAARDPDSFASQAAQFNLAVLHLKAGRLEAGFELLRELEKREGVAHEVAARAMLVRALYLEEAGLWDEALPILRRIARLHPYTEAANEAPLAITAHYARSGETSLALRSLERATDYYLELIDRGSRYAGNRLAVQDLLIEGYLSVGKGDEVAELLEASAVGWDEHVSAGGMYRVSVLYSEILDEPEEAARILKKCIEMFPETRYAKIAQWGLDRLQGRL